MQKMRHPLILVSFLLTFASCSSNGLFLSPPTPTPTPTPPAPTLYAVGGTVTGLDGIVVLQNNGSDDLRILANGTFQFATSLADGAAYDVTVLTQPTEQTCTVTNGSGTVATAVVTTVSIACTGNVTTATIDVTGSPLTLITNGATGDLTITNVSTTITATNITSIFTSTALDGNVTETGNTCASIVPNASCTLTYTPGSTAVGQTSFSIQGSNTTTATAEIVITAPPATTLLASVSTLGLSVNNVGLNAALTGTPRQITIANTGADPAIDVTYSPLPALPVGTTISPASCGTIAASDTCVVTITPGATPSVAPGDTSPTPITLSVSGTNTNTLTPTVNILTYGSLYQGGFIFAVDDTTPSTNSIGGTVVTQTDQDAGILWSANSGGSPSFVAVYGISETSTTISANPSSGFVSGQNACNGKSDGSCDSHNIYLYYFAHSVSTSLYATGLCKATISGYNDWYLPAICELGPASNGSGCSAGTQNIVNQLSDLVGDPGAGTPSTSCTYGANCLAGVYWSSTEYSGIPNIAAWYQYFASGGGSIQNNDFKDSTFGVRCSRTLTP